MACDKMKRVRTSSERQWREEHEAHGKLAKSYPPPQPPTYKLAHLRCPCGEVFIRLEEAQDEV